MTEFFQKIINDHRLTSHHVSLYFVFMARAWQEGQTFNIERRIIMEQAKIRSRSTYTRCLHQLQEWGYLNYKPAPNQFQTSEITLAMPKNEPSTDSAMPKSALSAPNAMPIHEPSTEFAMLKTVQSDFSAMPKNEQSNFLKHTDNQYSHFGMPKTGHSKSAPPPLPSSSYRNELSIKLNDVGGDDVPRARPKSLPTDHPFSQSPYFDWPTFQAAFSEGTRFQNVDLKYYYDALCDWRDRTSGLPPLRSDWLRTARVFMRNDAKNHKLALLIQPIPSKPSRNDYQPPIISNEKYRRT